MTFWWAQSFVILSYTYPNKCQYTCNFLFIDKNKCFTTHCCITRSRLFVCVCVCVCVCVWVGGCVWVWVGGRAGACVRPCVLACVFALCVVLCVHTCVFDYVYVHAYICCVRICVFTCEWLCVLCMYIHMYYVAIGSRKRHRSFQEDEGVPELKQREALSDQSTFAEDIEPARSCCGEKTLVMRKTSLQAEIVSVLAYAYISYVP